MENHGAGEAGANATSLQLFDSQKAELSVSRPQGSNGGDFNTPPNNNTEKAPPNVKTPAAEAIEINSSDKETHLPRFKMSVSITLDTEGIKAICDCVSKAAAYSSEILRYPQVRTVGIIAIGTTAAVLMTTPGAFDTLPTLIAALFEGIAKLIVAPFDGVAKLIEPTCDGLPKLIVAPFDGVAKLIEPTCDGLPKLIVAPFDGAAKLTVATLDGVAKITAAPFEGFAKFVYACTTGVTEADTEKIRSGTEAIWVNKEDSDNVETPGFDDDVD